VTLSYKEKNKRRFKKKIVLYVSSSVNWIFCLCGPADLQSLSFFKQIKKKSYNFYSKILQLIQKNIKVDTSWLTLPNIVAT
jgi:hypothetical protein